MRQQNELQTTVKGAAVRVSDRIRLQTEGIRQSVRTCGGFDQTGAACRSIGLNVCVKWSSSGINLTHTSYKFSKRKQPESGRELWNNLRCNVEGFHSSVLMLYKQKGLETFLFFLFFPQLESLLKTCRKDKNIMNTFHEIIFPVVSWHYSSPVPDVPTGFIFGNKIHQMTNYLHDSSPIFSLSVSLQKPLYKMWATASSFPLLPRGLSISATHTPRSSKTSNPTKHTYAHSPGPFSVSGAYLISALGTH